MTTPTNTTATIQAPISITDIHNLVPEYDGSSQNLDTFLACRNLLFSTAKSKAEQTLFLSIIKTKLRGPAFEVVQYKSLTKWDALAQELKTNFKEEKSRSSVQNELLSIKQGPKESVKEFGDRLTTVLTRLDTVTYSNIDEVAVKKYLLEENAKLAVQVFEDGLRNYHLRILVKAHAANSLRKAIAYAVEHASRMERLNPIPPELPTRSAPSRPFCENCNRVGHTRSSCYRNTNLPNFPPKTSKKEVNHLICAYCKKPNHHIEECRLRQRNNARFQSSQQRPNSPNNQNFPRDNQRNHVHHVPNSHNYKIENNGPSENNTKSGNEFFRDGTSGNPSRITVQADVHHPRD